MKLQAVDLCMAEPISRSPRTLPRFIQYVTSLYRPPELWDTRDNLQLPIAVDMWRFGCIVFEAVSAQPLMQPATSVQDVENWHALLDPQSGQRTWRVLLLVGAISFSAVARGGLLCWVLARQNPAPDCGNQSLYTVTLSDYFRFFTCSIGVVHQVTALEALLADHALSPWYKVQRRDKKKLQLVFVRFELLKVWLMSRRARLKELLSACEPKQLAQQKNRAAPWKS